MGRYYEPVGCICGHDTSNPVRISHVNAGPEDTLPVCRSCVGKPDVRETVGMVFGGLIETHRKTYIGPTPEERRKAAGINLANWPTKKGGASE